MDDEKFGGYGGEEGGLAPREPSVEDLVQLCRALNSSGCRYVVVGGFAIIGAGYSRRTMDIDFLVDASLENEEKVYRVLEVLPDQAVKQLDPGDIAKFTVVRVADEIVVDLMQSACGIAEFLPEYRAAGDSVLRPVVVGNGHTRARNIEIGRGLEGVILLFKSKSKSQSKSRSKTSIDRDFDRIGSDLLDCVGWMVGCGMGWRFRYEGEDGLKREVDLDFDFDFEV